MDIFGGTQRGLIFTTAEFDLIGGLQYIEQNKNDYFVNSIDIEESFKRKGYGSLLHLSFREVVKRKNGKLIKGRIDIENIISLTFHRELDFLVIPNSSYGDEFYNVEYRL